jgi:dCTP deaminase
MYSHQDILKAIEKKELFVEPFNEKALRPNALALMLDSEIAVPKKGKIDPLKTENYGKFYKIIKLKPKQKFGLKSGAFILARTKEKISISNKLGVLLDGSTTLARLGISVAQTAALVHTGHGVPVPRKIVLEIKNNGPFAVSLTEGMHIAQLAVFELKTPSKILYDSIGKYGQPEYRDKLLPAKE